MKPRIRPVEIQPVGDGYLIRDPLGLSQGLIVSQPALLLMSLMDGRRDLLDIKADFLRLTGYLLKEEELRDFLNMLERAMLLDGEAFERALQETKESLLRSGVRPMSHAGEAYPAEPSECLAFLRGEEKVKEDLLGLLVPHMDLRVAKDTYWEGYGRLGEDKELVVILGVSHYWHEMPFSALPLDMETPFGILKTRKDLVEKLQKFYNFDITHDLLAYRQEHSIEFASLYVKMLFPQAQALALIISYGEPDFLKELAENLLRTIEKELYRSLIISSVDLSHVGRKFGDHESYDPSFRDREYLKLLEELRVEDAFELLKATDNSTRIDGQYTNTVFAHMLRSAGLKGGRIFDYQIYHEDFTDSKVSYASMGF